MQRLGAVGPAAGRPMERPTIHISVGSEADIVRAVQAARVHGGRVRALGARGSKNDSHRTSGVALHLEQYRRLLSVEDNLVTVQAGMTCGELNAVLERHGLALPSMGEWKRATVAGALLTGTHGGSSRHGIMPTSVRRIRLVAGDGRVIDLQKGDSWFPHAGVSLGALGVVSTVTFECVEQFRLALETKVVSFDRYLLEYEEQSRENEFYSAIWLPAADAVIAYAANRTTALAGAARRRERFSPRTLLLTALSRYWNIKGLVNDRRFAQLAVGNSGEILTPLAIAPSLANAVWRVAKTVRATEFAVPAPKATATMAELNALLRRHPGNLANAIGLRTTAQDDFSLSPCYQRECLWVDVFFYDRQEFVAALSELFEGLDACCHWGKHVAFAPGYLRRQYPRWDAFVEACAQLDPTGVFANDFTERYGLLAPSAIRVRDPQYD